MIVPEQSSVLSSWKDIARYMGKGVRTVQRWERELGLPVRRPTGASQKSAVMLHRTELDLWLETRFTARPAGKNIEITPNQPGSPGSSRFALRESIRTARELRRANLLLTQQIAQSLRTLNEQCNALTFHVQEAAWSPAIAGTETGTHALLNGPEQII